MTYDFCKIFSFFVSDIAWELFLHVFNTVSHVFYNNQHQLYMKRRNSIFFIKFIWMGIGKIGRFWARVHEGGFPTSQ